MSIYRYADTSPVREVVFHHARGCQKVAFLKAASNASSQQLSSAREAMNAAGWQALPVYIEKQPVLQVSGFKQETELSNFLRAGQFATGEAAIMREPNDNPRLGLKEHIKSMSLRLTGLLNIIGDIVLAISGHNKGDPYRIAGGSMLTLGSLNLMRYGNAKPEHYMREISQDMIEFIRNQNGTPSQSTYYQPKGTFTNAENFLYRHPAQVTLGINSVGATSNLISGIRKFHDKGGWGALGFGMGSVGLKLAALLIPEKSRDEIEQSKGKQRNVVRKMIDWIQEKPLRFYGAASLITDLFLGVDAYHEYKKNPKKWGVYASTAIAGLSYSLADIMVAMSSKDHTNNDGKFAADEQRAIEAMASESVANQPEQSQGSMAQKLGNFLSKRKEMRGNAQSISQSIIEQTRHLKDNPWTVRSSQDPTPSMAEL